MLSASGLPAGRADAVAHTIATQQGGRGGGSAAVANAAQVAFISALNEILLVATCIAFAGAVLGLLLVSDKDFAHGAEVETVAAAA